MLQITHSPPSGLLEKAWHIYIKPPNVFTLLIRRLKALSKFLLRADCGIAVVVVVVVVVEVVVLMY